MVLILLHGGGAQIRAGGLAPLPPQPQQYEYKLLCPRGTQTCALAVANIAHAVYFLDVAKRPIPQG